MPTLAQIERDEALKRVSELEWENERLRAILIDLEIAFSSGDIGETGITLAALSSIRATLYPERNASGQ